ncbi:putative permease [Thiogranum longum]|uniref:Putative permease n=1 Tax=Thiogranum longum TaxID=1537524 RepID=A0A4R1HA41_9GAMM|nr:AI-2E family transporter [Thiogranum longum]TCK17411.1 putative permease [Thiogranum longum]
MEVIRQWFRRHFSDPQVVILALVLLLGFVVVITMGKMLAPVLAALVLAYLLEGVVTAMQRLGAPRLVAVILVFLVFIIVLVFALLGLLPKLSYQVTQLFQQLPNIIGKGQDVIMHLPEQYPGLVSEAQVADLMNAIRAELGGLGQRVVSVSMASVFGIMMIMVYLILVPLLVFFFLKDKQRIIEWFQGYLPKERALTTRVWQDVNVQIANYVRGKAWEILIVGGVSYITFTIMGLQYAVLLSTLVGLSVIIPYIGAAAVTLPIAAIAFFQWGWSSDSWYVLLAYGVIQALDGNILVPLLFSEVVNLHPVAIIIAVVVFGGLWGFWGVFFAIPLATLVQAVLKAWPKKPLPETDASTA